jgi:hypothetical protein
MLWKAEGKGKIFPDSFLLSAYPLSFLPSYLALEIYISVMEDNSRRNFYSGSCKKGYPTECKNAQ